MNLEQVTDGLQFPEGPVAMNQNCRPRSETIGSLAAREPLKRTFALSSMPDIRQRILINVGRFTIMQLRMS